MADSSTEHPLPASEHTERVVLGNMIGAPPDQQWMADEVAAQLSEQDFSLDSHRRIFATIRRMRGAGIQVDFVTLIDDLKTTKTLDAIGGRPYIMALCEDLPRVNSWKRYIEILREKRQARSLIAMGEAVQREAWDGSLKPSDVIVSQIQRLQEALDASGENELTPVGEWLVDDQQLIAGMSSTDGIPSGFNRLDQMLDGGFQRGELVVVAARPSMGKTAWAVNAAMQIAVRGGRHAALFTLEQKKAPVLRRMVSGMTRIDSKQIKLGDLNREEQEILSQHFKLIREAPLFLDDTPGLTVSRIRAKCRRMQQVYGLDVVLIDQLSHVNDSDVAEKNMPKHERVGKQTKALKRMAQDLNIPVILFNQISRSAKNNKDHHPTLTDLKESGSLEEDADVVILLHRPEYYDRSDENLKGKGEMIIAKQREGETGTAHCHYNASILRWIDPSEVTAKQRPLASEYEVPPLYTQVQYDDPRRNDW